MSEPMTSLEHTLSEVLRALGTVVGTRPWPFLLLPLVLSGALGSGFIYLNSFDAYDMEGLLTTIWNMAKEDRNFVQANFPTRDAERFLAQRLSTEGTFAALLAVATGDTLLTQAALAELLALDRAVRELRTPEHTFAQLCARSHGACSSPNPLLSALQDDPARIDRLLPNLTWPLAFKGRVFLAPFLGGVKLGPEGGKRESPVVAAKALRLLYYLQEDDPSQRKASELWLRSFMERIPKVLGSLNLISVQVAHFTSLSRQEEFETRTKKVIPLLSIMYFLTVFLSIISCARLDCVRTRVWVAAFGVFSSGLSVLSGFGLLFFCGVPFFFTIVIIPFLALGVSIDNTFILVSCWQRTKVKSKVKERIAETYAEAAVSITINNLINIFTIVIADKSSFQSVRSFCLYTGIAFFFCFLYSLTFLGAVLALNGRREESNRHWLTFMKVETEPQDSRGCAYNMCCVGGAFDESTGTETEHTMNGFFKKHYGPFLMHTWAKVLVVILYLLYLGSSIFGVVHGIIQREQGIDFRSVTDDNDTILYFDWEKKYFSEYGPRIMVVVSQSIEYWNSSVRVELEKCMESLENSPNVDKELSESWLRIYGYVALHMYLNMDDKNFFMANLTILFNIAPESQWDLNFSNTEISTSRFYVQTANVTSATGKRKHLRQLRNLAKNCKIPVIVYHPAFIYSDRGNVITRGTIVTVLAQLTLLACLTLIPNALFISWLLFAFASVSFGVIGYMHFWGVNLYPIAELLHVIDIQFLVNFCSRIAYGFASSEQPEVNDKAVDALYCFGYPVAQGAVSIIMGVAVVCGAANYIFKTYFKIIFLSVLLAAIHGLIFTPVFLTFCGCCFHAGNRKCLCC